MANVTDSSGAPATATALNSITKSPPRDCHAWRVPKNVKRQVASEAEGVVPDASLAFALLVPSPHRSASLWSAKMPLPALACVDTVRATAAPTTVAPGGIVVRSNRNRDRRIAPPFVTPAYRPSPAPLAVSLSL